MSYLALYRKYRPQKLEEIALLYEEYLKEITTIYREDNVGMRQDKEALDVVENIHAARTKGGYGLGVFSKDLKKKLGE